jgi:hypothetical protein
MFCCPALFRPPCRLLLRLSSPLGPQLPLPCRYRAVHRYVKNHVGQAVLRVTLWNAGADAYRRAELGPEVTVVRRINASSRGSFEVLDHTGRVVSWVGHAVGMLWQRCGHAADRAVHGAVAVAAPASVCLPSCWCPSQHD